MHDSLFLVKTLKKLKPVLENQFQDQMTNYHIQLNGRSKNPPLGATSPLIVLNGTFPLAYFPRPFESGSLFTVCVVHFTVSPKNMNKFRKEQIAFEVR